jgi:hypothetical protein
MGEYALHLAIEIVLVPDEDESGLWVGERITSWRESAVAS